MIIAGIDPSLRSTGIAIVDTEVGVIETRRIRGDALTKTAGPIAQSYRIRDMAQQVADVLLGVESISIEGLSLGSKSASKDQLAGLWWAIIQTVTDQHPRLSVHKFAPQTRAKYQTGSGRAGKHDVLASVRSEYPDVDVENNDVADAIVLAAMLARQVGEPIDRHFEWRAAA